MSKLASERTDLLAMLKAIRIRPRTLTASEVDRLIRALSGKEWKRGRPRENVLGLSRRRLNWTATAEVVFRFIENGAAENRRDAEQLAAEWFVARGVMRTRKQIKNELDALRQAAGLRKLGINEWRTLRPSKASTPRTSMGERLPVPQAGPGTPRGHLHK